MSRPVVVETGSAAATAALAEGLASLLGAGDVVVCSGDLGAGKTAFAKGLGAGLGVRGPVVSPTFTLAREYEGRLRMVHADVYRLDRVQELIDLGLDEAAHDAVLVVEWGDVVADELAPDRLDVRLDFVDARPDARRITLMPHGQGWERRWDDLVAVARSAA
ncbi:MAG: tRNA (adenosine(37)-N6)-threonylcarbamoyltransferase complex ATPase subunit type 1 TsaE [Actinomycetes bacterium]